MNSENARLDQLKESQESEAEIKRKQQLLKNLEEELKRKKKDSKELEKKLKNRKNLQKSSYCFNQAFLSKQQKETPWKKDLTAQKVLML